VNILLIHKRVYIDARYYEKFSMLDGFSEAKGILWLIFSPYYLDTATILLPQMSQASFEVLVGNFGILMIAHSTELHIICCPL
jgi:hypothetical protein